MDSSDLMDLLHILELAEARSQSAILFAIMIFAVCLWYLQFAFAQAKPSFRDLLVSDRVIAADLVLWHPRNESYFEFHKARHAMSQVSSKIFVYKSILSDALAKWFLDTSKEWHHGLVMRADVFLSDADREALVQESIARQAIIVTSADLSLPFVVPRKFGHRIVIDTLLQDTSLNFDDACSQTLDTFETLGVPIQKTRHTIQQQTLE